MPKFLAAIVRRKDGSVLPKKGRTKSAPFRLLSSQFDSFRSSSQIRILTPIAREIDRLRERVRELEGKLQGIEVRQQLPTISPDGGTPQIKQEDVLPEQLDPLYQHGGNRNYYNWDFVTRQIKPGSTQTYGISSTFYFVNQMSTYLDAAVQHTISITHSAPQSSSTERTIYSVLTGRDSSSRDLSVVQQDLSRAEEERLLKLYWASWHILYPILDEKAFGNYYMSLWKASSGPRDPSALVDIILALCLQYDAALQTSGSNGDTSRGEPTDSTAGWWFYRRCQYFLQDDLEDPSITTFQCHFLAVIWLSRASWQNAAHNVLAAGLRIGVILGLHVDPCPDLAPELREYRKRLWWTMYAIDAQYAMEFGRPLGVHFGQVTCSLPKDQVSPTDDSQGLLTPQSFNTQLINLILATRAVYIMFYRVCAKVLRKSGKSNIYDDYRDIETCAEWLDTNISYLKAWLRQVPDALKIPRKNFGQSYSTDRSLLDLPKTDSMSRGRLILELLYHQFSMHLYRTFVTFGQKERKKAPITERHAISCVNHAITITSIIHQDITESDSLRVWQMTCIWQWNAAISLVGYILAYPRGPVTPIARQALQTALENFKLLSPTFTTATRANEVLRDLMKKVDFIEETQYAITALEDDYRGTPTSASASTLDGLDVSGLRRGSSKGKDRDLQDGASTWIGPEFDLLDFSSFENSNTGEDWVFNLVDFGMMDYH